MIMDAFIHQRFSRAADKFPTNSALWSENGTLTYKELADSSDSLSRWLTKRLPGKGHRIALVLPKSCEAIVAIFGILKSGNTYVPLGDNWTAGRIQKICHDGQFSLLVTDKKNRGLDFDASKILSVGSELWLEATDQPTKTSLAAQTVTEDDTAYILYTSGSTGTPKGVCVSHRAAAYFPQWAEEEFSINSIDRIASVSPLTFDLSTFDLFTTLSAGATLYIVPEKLKVFPARFSEFLQTHGITCLYAVPSTLVLLAQRGKLINRDLNSLKTVLFAGEEFPVPLFKTLREALPSSVQYCNLYGPTETNVCTYYRVPVDFDKSVFPIGRGLPKTHLFMRDTQLNIQNNTQLGELCVAGPAVMSGYFGQDDKDANYWVSDPQGIEHRAYATGDQVSPIADEEWLYHGRLDKMVKIWGYRVELGEVEACLLELPDTEQVIVVKRSGKDTNNSILVAFILRSSSIGLPLEKSDLSNLHTHQSDKEREVVSQDIRQAISHCKNNLPAYMVPKEIIFLNEIPTNHTGKVDRWRLEKIAENNNNYDSN